MRCRVVLALHAALALRLEPSRFDLEPSRFGLRRGLGALNLVSASAEPQSADYQQYQLRDEHGVRNHGPVKLSRIHGAILAGVNGREHINQVDVAVAVVVFV